MKDVHKLSYLRKTFYLTHAIGLAVGLLFPLPASLIIGPVAFTFPFISSCLLTGFAMAAIMFLLIRTILKKQLKQTRSNQQRINGCWVLKKPRLKEWN